MYALAVPFLKYSNTNCPSLGRLGKSVGYGNVMIFEVLREAISFHQHLSWH